MDLVQMCLQGSAMVLVVLALRALFLKRLPKAAFLVLWGAVLVRLLVPVSIPVPVNAWTVAEQGLTQAGIVLDRDASDAGGGADAAADATPTANPGQPSAPTEDGSGAPSALPSALAGIPAWRIAWAAGTLVCLAVFGALHARYTRHFRFATLVRTVPAQQWLAAHRLRGRTLSVKECASVHSPMTYGVLRPCILVPPGFDWSDRTRATLVLEHEFVHAWRFDAVFKGALAVAACLYWFDPLVWAMYLVANRDIELACDERVSRKLNESGRAKYAHALLDTAEHASAPIPVPAFIGFSRSAIEERVLAIVDTRLRTPSTTAATILLVLTVTAALATSSAPLQEALDISWAGSGLAGPTVHDAAAGAPDLPDIELTGSAFGGDVSVENTEAGILVDIGSYRLTVPYGNLNDASSYTYYATYEPFPALTDYLSLYMEDEASAIRGLFNLRIYCCDPELATQSAEAYGMANRIAYPTGTLTADGREIVVAIDSEAIPDDQVLATLQSYASWLSV